ncbi:hypothetical protein NDU88_007250 [Pleurodeles waltl]|uniref:Uncharacterized protein n=1 Tax=Pleurodeles waltl TaxID=8319 RepID=A0AAV7MIM2_PLEWA|nr:hypothetical protein NDU88_007250 [Pleurodeles waltl]
MHAARQTILLNDFHYFLPGNDLMQQNSRPTHTKGVTQKVITPKHDRLSVHHHLITSPCQEGNPKEICYGFAKPTIQAEVTLAPKSGLFKDGAAVPNKQQRASQAASRFYDNRRPGVREMTDRCDNELEFSIRRRRGRVQRSESSPLYTWAGLSGSSLVTEPRACSSWLSDWALWST